MAAWTHAPRVQTIVWDTQFGTFGRAADLDRAERIAFNALPATWASPTGGDMWAHQYLQAVNQISAKLSHPHVWKHDGDDSERYGLAPNFGCCTANFNQGWPKLAHHAIYITPPSAPPDTMPGVAVGVLAPLHAKLPFGGGLDVDTHYPFSDEVTLTATAASKPYTLHVRVPGWAGGSGGSAELLVGGTASPVSLDGKNGTIVLVGTVHSGGTPLIATLRLKPRLRIEQWAKGAFSIHRGPLMFSLPVSPSFATVAHHWGSADQSNDYDVSNASSWQYALVADASDPDAHLTFERKTGEVSMAPFNRTGWRVVVRATVRALPTWGITLNSASIPPPSPACSGADAGCGEPKEVELVPHGASDLRIGQFPLA